MSDDCFVITVNNKRRIRVAYKREGMYHHYSSPDVPGCTTFAKDKAKAYAVFHKKLMEVVK
jgi:hypothetical protein